MDDPSGVPAAVPADEVEGSGAISSRIVRLQEHDPDREARWAAWRAEHAGAITSWNDYVERNGLPLAGYRLF